MAGRQHPWSPTPSGRHLRRRVTLSRHDPQGAILQEVIDVAVILNALRALRIVPGQGDPASKVAA